MLVLFFQNIINHKRYKLNTPNSLYTDVPLLMMIITDNEGNWLLSLLHLLNSKPHQIVVIQLLLNNTINVILNNQSLTSSSPILYV